MQKRRNNYHRTELRNFKEQYLINEDKNYHRENYSLLAEAFGNKSEIQKVNEIMNRSEANGRTSREDNNWMFENINKYYNEIRNF